MVEFEVSDGVKIRIEGGRHYLVAYGVSAQVLQDEAHRVLVQVLPLEELVWSVNGEPGDCFYDPAYPPSSAMPSPRRLVGGNVYYANRADALLRLRLDVARKKAKALENYEERVRELSAAAARVDAEIADEERKAKLARGEHTVNTDDAMRIQAARLAAAGARKAVDFARQKAEAAGLPHATMYAVVLSGLKEIDAQHSPEYRAAAEALGAES